NKGMSGGLVHAEADVDAQPGAAPSEKGDKTDKGDLGDDKDAKDTKDSKDSKEEKSDSKTEATVRREVLAPATEGKDEKPEAKADDKADDKADADKDAKADDEKEENEADYVPKGEKIGDAVVIGVKSTLKRVK